MLQTIKDNALAAKADGNRLFTAQAYHDAITAYSIPLDGLMEEFVRSETMMSKIASTIVGDIYDILGKLSALWVIDGSHSESPHKQGLSLYDDFNASSSLALHGHRAASEQPCPVSPQDG